MLTITILSGSARNGRKTHQVAEFLAQEFKNHPGVERVHLLDVLEYNFPIMDERLRLLENPHPGLQDFSNKMAEAHALVIVSPEYNSGISGALKNTLDYFHAEYGNKPIAPVTVSSGSFGGLNAMHQLVYFIYHVGGFLVNAKLPVSNVNQLFDEAGKTVDERFVKNAGNLVNKTVWLAERVKTA